MRLIHSVTRQLQDFSQGEVPPYAILSHTWGEEEVSFQNISSPRCELYKGYGKILQACNVAAEHGLEYVWIDTCCIDKTNSAELMESINSMYSWYSDAVVCYVYLEDLGPDSKIEDSLQGCRWFTRGWTLQELLAPRIVELYDKDWCFRGTSLDFVHCISRITGIEQSVLRGGAIADCSVAMRMSWAARRRTTRIEDISYCLLGIFDVHMPLMYGEGSAAFRRLQEEIIKRNNDTTIFAWENDLSQDPKLLGAFAPSPAFFKDCSQVGPFAGQFPDFSATNKGILVSPEMHVRAVSTEKYDAGSAGHLRTRSYLLYLGHHVMHCDVVGIHLRKIGPNLFCRDGTRHLAGLGESENFETDREATKSQCYIITDVRTQIQGLISNYRRDTVHIPVTSPVPVGLLQMAPEPLWDHSDRVVLLPQYDSFTIYPMVFAALFQYHDTNQSFEFIVFCDHRGVIPLCKLSYARNHSAELFRGKYRWEYLDWYERDAEFLHSPTLTDTLDFEDGQSVHRFKLSAFFKTERVSGFFGDHESFCLNFKLEKVQQRMKSKL